MCKSPKKYFIYFLFSFIKVLYLMYIFTPKLISNHIVILVRYKKKSYYLQFSPMEFTIAIFYTPTVWMAANRKRMRSTWSLTKDQKGCFDALAFKQLTSRWSSGSEKQKQNKNRCKRFTASRVGASECLSWSGFKWRFQAKVRVWSSKFDTPAKIWSFGFKP